jgi:Flp pilus assembly protein TadG
MRSQREKSKSCRGGFLRRLMGDRRGNTLAMMAALLIPLIGMVGSGVDMARAYMAKAKLQTACDAAATAARRVMAASAFNDTVRQEGKRFFKFNFPAGTMNTTTFEPSVEASTTDASVVEVSASTNVPTEIMGIFGATSIPISVKCQADKDYVNNDIMLVLDVTGSMNCTAGSGSSCSYATSPQSNSRISRLRSAAVELYRTLDDATGVRIRYGFMPYSMTVNVGRDMQAAWLAPASVYHTRTCNSTYSGYPDMCASWGSSWSTTTVNRTTAQYNTMIANPNGFCLEERSSIDQSGTGATGITISSTVSQSDIDTVGGAARYLWQPYDTTSTSYEQGYYSNLARFCPKPAKRLATYATENAFQTALEQAVGTAASTDAVGGYTNHDLGITWGLRYISGTGMFAAQNPDTWDATADGTNNPVPVRRHIVFLTDGDMTSDDSNYSAYGIKSARRRLSGGTDEEAKHRARFLNACNRARAMNVTVWVIALDTPAGAAEVKDCATDANHFFVSNGSDLATVFQLIGKGIGKLRLTE